MPTFTGVHTLCLQRYHGEGFVFDGEDERGALYVSVKQVEMVGLDRVAQQQRSEHTHIYSLCYGEMYISKFTFKVQYECNKNSKIKLWYKG